MNKTVFMLMALALVATACGSTATPAPAAKFSIPWGSGDHAEYSILVSGQAVASLALTTAQAQAAATSSLLKPRQEQQRM